MRSVKATKKITKAMELISASRIVKAQQRVAASSPYANELTRAVTAVASFSSTNHPLTTPHESPRRAAVLIITADRGMAGAYSNAAIKEGDQLITALRERGLSTEEGARPLITTVFETELSLVLGPDFQITQLMQMLRKSLTYLSMPLWLILPKNHMA